MTKFTLYWGKQVTNKVKLELVFQPKKKNNNCLPTFWCQKDNEGKMTGKICKPELWFLCITFDLMELYISVKFYQNISNSFGVIYQIHFVTDRQPDGHTGNKQYVS